MDKPVVPNESLADKQGHGLSVHNLLKPSPSVWNQNNAAVKCCMMMF